LSTAQAHGIVKPLQGLSGPGDHIASKTGYWEKPDKASLTFLFPLSSSQAAGGKDYSTLYFLP
jgi:hypothetical protein